MLFSNNEVCLKYIILQPNFKELSHWPTAFKIESMYFLTTVNFLSPDK